MKNYVVKDKDIFVTVEKLTDEEMKVVKKYLDLGYTMKEMVVEKKPPKVAFREDVIKAWLEKNAKEKLEVYDWYYNQQAKTIDKETKEKVLKFKKDGSPILKGHIGTLAWFKDEFPNYPEEKDKEWIKEFLANAPDGEAEKEKDKEKKRLERIEERNKKREEQMKKEKK